MAGTIDDDTFVGFHTRCDGFLFCDNVKISQLHQQLKTSHSYSTTPTSPAFVYSRRRLERNVQQFYQAMATLPVPTILHFSMKSNPSLKILTLLRSLGCGVTLVSGMELQVALEAGFEPRTMLLNGSGKMPWEVAVAIKGGVLLNVDSEFDLQQTVDICRQLGTRARVLLRVNLDIDPKVHKYVSTGKAGSKFGLDPAALSRVVHVLTSDDCPVHVEGLHCHLGSTIRDTAIFRESVTKLLALRQELKNKGLKDLNLINVGGGLAIDYTRYRDDTLPYREEDEEVQKELERLMENLQQETASQNDQHKKTLLQSAADVVVSYVKERIPRSEMDRQLNHLFQRLGTADIMRMTYPAIWRQKPKTPTPTDLTRCLTDVFEMPRDNDVTLVFEPGRAVVGDAGVFITTALGCKAAGNTKFLVVDGAMNDVIRPSLYDAYHHIYPAAPPSSTDHAHNAAQSAAQDVTKLSTNGHGDFHVVDVVGPVCESGDFLGKDRLLPLPMPGACVVLHDAGAYCSSMASNYNLRPRPAEVLVDGSDWDFIRRPDTLKDIMAPYKTQGK